MRVATIQCFCNWHDCTLQTLRLISLGRVPAPNPLGLPCLTPLSMTLQMRRSLQGQPARWTAEHPNGPEGWAQLKGDPELGAHALASEKAGGLARHVCTQAGAQLPEPQADPKPRVGEAAQHPARRPGCESRPRPGRGTAREDTGGPEEETHGSDRSPAAAEPHVGGSRGLCCHHWLQ